MNTKKYKNGQGLKSSHHTQYDRELKSNSFFEHARHFSCFFMNLGSYGSFDYAHSVNAKSTKKRVMDFKLICAEGIPPEYAYKKVNFYVFSDSLFK